MNFSDVKATERQYELLHPKTDEPMGLTFTLRPDTSPEVKAFERNWLNQQLRRSRGKMPTAEQLEQKQLEQVVASVAGWAWSKNARGEDPDWQGMPEFSVGKLREFLTEFSWAQKQLSQELGSEGDFFGNSPSN